MNERYLSHLENCIPEKANNYMLSTYSIILEAWRRGLEINIKILLEKSGAIEPYYSISDGNKTHHFSATRGDLVSVEAKELTKNKQTTKELLLKNNVPTPVGKEFDETISDQDIIQYANTLQYPIVVKPLNGTGGKGVIANIKNEDELIEALEYVRRELKRPHIIVEKYFEGDDYRLYIIDGKVVGALKRVRSHVIGDGKSTIKQLIDSKNKKRSALPSLTNRPITVDKETRTLLKRKNYDMDTVLQEGEVFYLKTKNNVSAGGDSIDITDNISDNIKQIAVAATNSIPSLPHCGIDMIVDEKNDSGVVIEINSRAHITQHLFPMEGAARDIPSHIIDFYFPETFNYNRAEANKLYIDYDFIYDACIGRNAAEIKVPKISNFPIVLRRFLITNCEYTEEFAQKVKRLAFNHKINGYIKHLENGNIAIIVGSSKAKLGIFEKKLESLVTKSAPGSEIIRKVRKTPIQHGFHILEPTTNSNESNDISYLKKYSNLKGDYQRLVRNLQSMNKEKDLQT
ncbi:ATP-grasp domain-containing protein [Ornithinibacillus sp. JPR2-1]|uniref:ATP-binding protein n=1 Tax=Ornithinibacillus sp. JPR2-1 TaxID=2094019 RepID=UPI0031DA5E96